MNILLLLLALNASPLPPDVEQECEDHVAALRTIKGVDVVFSCEDDVWLTFTQWAAYGEPKEAH